MAFLHKGWRFESESGPMLNRKERETLIKKVEDACEAVVPALPEAVFGKNRLTITHEASGHAFHFDAEGALTCWMRESEVKGSGGVRVTSASLNSWKQVFNAEQATGGGAADYDWTFSTNYCGTTTGRGETEQMKVRTASQVVASSAPSFIETPSFIESSFCTKVDYEAWLCDHLDAGTKTALEPPWRAHTGSGLDMTLLKRRDLPILHCLDLRLYEDDLDDNGETMVRIRLRVMPSCFLVLLRHALRVDGVLIRHHDTRLFHKFGAAHVLRDRRLAEARLQPLPKLDRPPRDILADGESTLPTCPPRSWAPSVPDEQQAAEKLAMVPAESEGIEELLL